VEWNTANPPADLGKLDIKQGTHSGITQTSTLQLSKEQLKALKAQSNSDPAHVFTCKISVGDTKTDYTATQTVNIYTLGN
jgi:hypothetical protein